jgi:hypothetical protein
MERSPRVVLTITAALLFSASCSDNASKPPDARVDKKTIRDQPLPDLADATADGPADRVRVEATVSDAHREGGKDGPKPDVGKDTGPTDIGTPLIYGTVTRTATPVGDAKGELYVGLYFMGIPIMPLASTQITADLSASGAKIPYGIYNAAPGGYTLFAFLDDNGNASSPFLMPDAGDLVMSAPLNVTVGSTPQKIDLVLDKVEGSIGDGGVSFGVLKGKVTSTVAPSGDGKGTLYISLHDQVPPAGQLTATVITNADLASPYASETYFLSALQPGNYYLFVFLDDNDNNNPFAPGPDKGDMVPAKPFQVHVVVGVQNQQDVVLDKLQP